MKEKFYAVFLVLAFLAFQGCGGVTPVAVERPLIPQTKANQKAVFEENEGLQVVWEDVKDMRDFYRGGVQHKIKAEKQFQDKAYAEAMKNYQSSNDFFTKVLQFMDEDCVEFSLYGEAQILFLPNLLMADNNLKMGMVARATGRESSAQGSWKKAQSFLAKSLQAEKTEWGLSMEKELSGLMAAK